MRTEADYPYEKGLRVEGLRGADKLRAIPDRELAAHALRLLCAGCQDKRLKAGRAAQRKAGVTGV